MERVAASYAQALFELAVEADSIQKYKDEFQSCIETIYMDADFIKLLKNPIVSKENKKEVLETIFKDSVSKNLLYFLYIIVDKNRTMYLKEIYKTFNKLINDYQNVENAFVYSVVKMTNEQLVSIKNKLQKEFNKEIIIENRIDKSLIAGIKIVIGNKVLDNSLKAQISNLQNELLDIKI